MMMHSAVVAGVLLLLPGLLAAQSSTPKYSNEFLKIGVGAQASAMGNAQTALANTVAAAYWNPAGLVHVGTRHELALMHSEYFAGIAKYDYGAFTTQLEDERRLALSVIRLGIDDIPNTLNFREGNSFDYARITSFSVADLAFILSYAQPLRFLEGLSVGGSMKVVNRTIGDFATAWGFGADLGLMYRRSGLSLGLMAQDLTSTFNAWTFNTETFEDAFIAAGQELPQNSLEITLPSVRLGVGYTFWAERAFNLSAALDWEAHFDGPRNTLVTLGGMSLDPRAGFEASYKRIVFLRAGVSNFQQVPNEDGQDRLNVFPSAGIGLAYKFAALDYALSNLAGFGNNLYSHLISLRISFGALRQVSTSSQP